MNATVFGRFLAGFALAAILGAGPAPALHAAPADVAMVNQVSGEVHYAGEGQAATKVLPFMRVRQGDRFIVSSGASVRLVFFQGARQETWTGPASFRAGVQAGEPFGDARPAVVILPATVPQKIARVPELMAAVRLGGVSIRGTVKPLPVLLTREQQGELDAARAAYRLLRDQSAVDDLTPELYLFSVLYDLGQEDELGVLVVQMRQRAPDSPEVRDLAAWLKGQSAGR